MRRYLRILGGMALLWPAIALAEPKDDARRYFIAGLEAAKQGNYEEALRQFLAAQAAYPHPSTLYNIGRAYQDLGDLPHALEYFRLYRDADPSKASEIDPVIAVVEARLRQGEKPPTAVPGEIAVQGDVIAKLQAIAAEMQAKVDEVNALTASLAASPDETPIQPVDPPPSDETPKEPAALPEGDLLTNAYERVVVTASRYGQAPLDSPSAVTILTAEDIRLSGAATIPDLLRRVVGVEAMQLASGHTDLSMRGFNRELGNKVLVLVDGRSTYLDFIGTTIWGTVPLALGEIERIEVIRGPGSAIYGANAVTGVINIITRTPGEGKNSLHFEAGSPMYGQGDAIVTGRVGENAYRLSAGYVQTGRWAKEIDPESTARTFALDNQDLGLRTLRANARIDRTFAGGKGFASLSGGYAEGVQEFYNIGALGDYYIDLKSFNLRGDAAYGPFHLRAFWNSGIGGTGAWSEPVDWDRSLYAAVDVDTVDVEIEGSHEFATGPLKHRFSAGISYRYKRTEFGYIPEPVREHHQAAFINEEASVGPVKLVGQLRADRHPLLPLTQTLSPRGAAIWRIRPTSSLRLSGGTSFRAPNHTESYMNFTLPTSSDGVFIQDYGDKTLKPERILTAELGFHDESTVYHTADLAIYVNRLTDIIDLRDVESAVTPENPQVEYDEAIGGFLAGSTGWTNTPSVYTGFGIEADTEVYPVDGLDIYGNFAFTRIYETLDGETTLDQSTSAVKLNLGVTYRTPFRTDLSFHSSYASAQIWGLRSFDSTGTLIVTPSEIDPRLLLTARVGVRPLNDDTLELAFNLWNATALSSSDAGVLGRTQEHPKGQPIGPRISGSATYRF